MRSRRTADRERGDRSPSRRRLFTGGSDRGVSETLGFVFVFSIIVLSVGTVYAVGMSGLEDARDAERVNNAERAFDVFADNVGDVVTGDAPSRATEVKLADARVYVGDPVTMNVSGTGASEFGFEYELAPIVYDTGDGTRLVYAGGAVFRTERQGGLVVSDPPFVLNSSRVAFPIVQTRSRSQSIGGSTTILLRARAADREILLGERAGDYDVTINVSSPRADLWRETLSARGSDVDCTAAANSPTFASCTVENADRVYVTVVRVDVEFER